MPESNLSISATVVALIRSNHAPDSILLALSTVVIFVHSNGGQVAKLRWQRMVDDVSKKGKLKNFIVVCDVPDNMWGIQWMSRSPSGYSSLN